MTQDIAKKTNVKTTHREAWRFTLVPFVTYMQMNGTVGTKYQSTHVNLSASDLAKDTRASGALAVEAAKGNHRIVLSTPYARLVADTTLEGSPGTVADATVELSTIEASYAYRLCNGSRFSLEAFGGIRCWNLMTKIEPGALTPGYTPRYSDNIHRVDPFAGLKFTPRLTEKLSTLMSADIGGFGVGSRIASKGHTRINYLLSCRIAAETGYGYTCTDYHKRGSIFDVILSGPPNGRYRTHKEKI